MGLIEGAVKEEERKGFGVEEGDRVLLFLAEMRAAGEKMFGHEAARLG